MKARYDTTCSVCEEAIPKGGSIEPLCGLWMHPGCKSQELARRLSEGRTTALPEARGAADVMPTAVKVRSAARKGWQSRGNVKVG